MVGPHHMGRAGQIKFERFKAWWYMKKHNRPHIEKCPSSFLDALVSHKVVLQESTNQNKSCARLVLVSIFTYSDRTANTANCSS